MRLSCAVTTSTIIRIGIDVRAGPSRWVLAPRRPGDGRVALDGGNFLLEVARDPLVAARGSIEAVDGGGAALAAQRDQVSHLVLVEGMDECGRFVDG